jgi:hypothetical protein
MGAHGAKQALQIANNVANIVAVELLVAAQALELRMAQPLASLYEIEKRLRNAEGLLLESTRNNLLKKAEQCTRLISELKELRKQVSSVKQKFVPGKGTQLVLQNVEKVLHGRGLPFPLRADTYLSSYITSISNAILNGEL